MQYRLGNLTRRTSWQATGTLVLLLVFLLAMMPGAAGALPPANMTPRAQPALLQLAAEQPARLLQVIVQKTTQDKSVERLVAQWGGLVTQDLSIIGAFAAEVPGEAIPALATAPGVRWISLDAPVKDSGKHQRGDATAQFVNAYVQTIGAKRLWDEDKLSGKGITVAVVDSGITQKHSDLGGANGIASRPRVLTWVNRSKSSVIKRAVDMYGHGTHVAGIIGGNGEKSQGAYAGVAPRVNLINVKVTDDQGASTTSDVVAGLQWIYENKDLYNIRVVNLSLNSSVPESYHTSPLNAALEILWFNGIVVIVSAGNNGGGDNNGVLYPPANDPFVITVGATDDRGTSNRDDDVLAHFSAHGITKDGFAKPDLVAPGTNIISLLAGVHSVIVWEHPDHLVITQNGTLQQYFRMSGTSMASAVTAGAVALLLENDPKLTPDQVKFRLMATARPFGAPGVGAGYLDIYAAVHANTTESANTGLTASQLLWTGSDPVNWNSVNWNSVNWNSVNWNSVNWNSVNWNSVNWNSVHWDN